MRLPGGGKTSGRPIAQNLNPAGSFCQKGQLLEVSLSCCSLSFCRILRSFVDVLACSIALHATSRVINLPCLPPTPALQLPPSTIRFNLSFDLCPRFHLSFDFCGLFGCRSRILNLGAGSKVRHFCFKYWALQLMRYVGYKLEMRVCRSPK
jgi:hypothetical protein